MGLWVRRKIVFDHEVRAAFASAAVEATRRRHREIKAPHLLWALLGAATVKGTLCGMRLEPSKVVEAVQARLTDLARYGWLSFRPPVMAYEKIVQAAAAKDIASGAVSISPTALLAYLELDSEDAAALRSAGFTQLLLRRYLAHGRVEIGAIPDQGIVDVVLYNDAFTTMEAVITILRQHFDIAEAEAAALMMKVHRTGSAVVASLKAEDARPKIEAARDHVASLGMPLRIEATREDG